MSTPSGFRPLRHRRVTEPDLPVTAEQIGIHGGQGRTGDEVNGSGRVIKWLGIAIVILIVASIVATPFISK